MVLLLVVQKSSVHQLRLVVYPIIFKVLYIPGGFLAGFLNHQQLHPAAELRHPRCKEARCREIAPQKQPRWVMPNTVVVAYYTDMVARNLDLGFFQGDQNTLIYKICFINYITSSLPRRQDTKYLPFPSQGLCFKQKRKVKNWIMIHTLREQK